MIRNFLRRPQSGLEYLADAIRVLGAVSVVVAGIWGTGTDAGILAFVLPALLIPRFIGVRAWFDTIYGATLLVAAWSNVADLYAIVPGWDLAVHFVCTGVLVAVAYLALVDLGVLAEPGPERTPARTPIVMASSLALAVSALWEMVEWFGFTFITDTIVVTYTDTIGDLVAGGLGGVCAGAMLAFVPLRRSDAVVRPAQSGDVDGRRAATARFEPSDRAGAG
jgi:hypothetical protein